MLPPHEDSSFVAHRRNRKAHIERRNAVDICRCVQALGRAVYIIYKNYRWERFLLQTRSLRGRSHRKAKIAYVVLPMKPSVRRSVSFFFRPIKIRSCLGMLAPCILYEYSGVFGGDRWQMRGTTPLHAAAGHFSADFASIVIGLLHAGACVDALDAAGRTPLQVCTRYTLKVKIYTFNVHEVYHYSAYIHTYPNQ